MLPSKKWVCDRFNPKVDKTFEKFRKGHKEEILVTFFPLLRIGDRNFTRFSNRFFGFYVLQA